MTPKPGEWYIDEHRVHKVVKVEAGVVTYADVYQQRGVARVALTRTSSLLQWEVDVAVGRLRRVVAA